MIVGSLIIFGSLLIELTLIYIFFNVSLRLVTWQLSQLNYRCSKLNISSFISFISSVRLFNLLLIYLMSVDLLIELVSIVDNFPSLFDMYFLKIYSDLWIFLQVSPPNNFSSQLTRYIISLFRLFKVDIFSSSQSRLRCKAFILRFRVQF